MIHVCFVFTDGASAKFIGTAMFSMFENISKPLPSVTVHILHDDTLTDSDRNNFSYLAGCCGQLVEFYDVEKICAAKLNQMIDLFPDAIKSRLNKAMFYKLLIPQILSTETEKAIYLETNVVVNADVSEIWRVELDDNPLAAVPALEIGSDIHTQDKAVADGLIKPEDYFNPGVLLMNLKILRGEENTIMNGLKFAVEHAYFAMLDQTVLNICFSLQTVKLPSRFNRFVRWMRRRKEHVAKEIYYYTGHSLQLDVKDEFNLLWLEYFVKTPWFSVESIGKLYEGFQQIHSKLKKSMINLSVVMNGKARAFCTFPAQVEELKKVFHINDAEEIVKLESQASLKQLIDTMKKSQGKKVFFIVARNFPFNVLTQAGFVYGKDFLNGMEFLSTEQGMSLNSYPLLYAM